MVRDSQSETGISPEDLTLLEKARNGDHGAFGELVSRYENRVAATVIGMLGYGAEAEDVGQETFIRFYKALPNFRGDSGLGTYLTRIAINLCLNALKRRKLRRGMIRSDSEEQLTRAAASRDRKAPLEARALVEWGLERLPPKYRTVLVLRLMDGYSTRETAEILGLPQGTVLSRLARAQARLKDELAPLYYDSRVESGENDG